MCQDNNIYTSLHKYLKEKKKTQKKDSRNQSTVAVTVLAQYKHTECTAPKYCGGIATFYIKIIFKGKKVIAIIKQTTNKKQARYSTKHYSQAHSHFLYR